MKLVFLVSIFFLISFKSETEDFFNPVEFKLNNGLKVIVLENKRAPVVAQMMWYDFGSGIEDKGKSGLAHFMEHLMFKGTKKFPKNFYSNFISQIGGTENAFTSYDYTAYYQVVPKSGIKKIMEMEADRMTNLTLTRKNVKIEKKVILEERFQRIESDPPSQLDESMKSILFPNHYYGRPIIGWKHEIEELSYEDVLKFYKKNYIPNNATLILSGDIDVPTAKVYAKRYFGRIKKGERSENIQTTNPDFKASAFVKLQDSTVKQPIWKKFYRTNSYKNSIKDGISMEIGLKILASGTSSLLYEKLVNEEKKFSAIGGYYQGLAKGSGSVYFYAIPNDDVDPKNIDEIIDREISRIMKNGIDLKRFEIEKKQYLFDSIYQMDGILNPAQIIGESIHSGIKLDDLLKWNKILEGITLKDIEKQLNIFKKNKNYVLGVLDS
ncbi:MAG: peptidase M16 [Rickettsiales bacterium]|mgnify:CR=1 FL=1|nr:peptidase M16 [Rickettsiales bacterium]